MHKTIDTSTATRTPDLQRGSIIVLTAGVVLLGLFLLGTIQLAYTFSMKRTLQNAADLAAISGAQALYSLDNEHDCERAIETAQLILTQNLKRHNVTSVSAPQCGEWKSTTEPDDERFTPGTTNPNAVRVHIQHTLPVLVPFMSQNTPIAASAIAASATTQPVAAFSVGPRLLDIDNGVIHPLLELAGLDLETVSIISYEGLANVSIAPSGLLRELGIEVPLNATVADLQELLDAQASLFEIAEASFTLAGSTGLLDAERIKILRSTLASGLELPDIMLRLFADHVTGVHGLFSLSSVGSDPAGLDTKIGMASIFEVMVSAALQKHALEIDVPDIDLGLLSLQVHVGVIEPPSIGIGPAGTTAHSANIRIFARICLADGCDAEALPSLPLGQIPLKAGIDLPIVLELVSGTGTLDDMCYPDGGGKQQVRISVEAELLTACIGKFNNDPASPNYAFSDALSCEQQIKNNQAKFGHDFVTLKFAHLELPSSPLQPQTFPGLTTPGAADFLMGESKLLPENGYDLALGTTLNKLTDDLLPLLVDAVFNSTGATSPFDPDDKKQIAQNLWDDAANEAGCNPNANNASGRACRESVSRQVGSNLHSATERVRSNSLDDFLVTALENILNLTGELLGNLIGAIFGNPCTGGGLLNPYGNEKDCVTAIANSAIVGDSSTFGAVRLPNILVPVLGMILKQVDSILQTPLDYLGEFVLDPLLHQLGLNIGQVETTLISLDCEASVRLVH